MALRTRRRWLRLLLEMVLLGVVGLLGCSPSSAVHAVGSASAAALRPPPPGMLLARLEEPSQPFAAPGTPIKIAFSRPVGNRTLVEARLRIRPGVSGQFEWLDDQTLLFVPDKLEYDTSYTIELAGLGHADQTADRWEWTFTTIRPIVLTFDDCGRSGLQLDQMLDTIAAKQAQGYPVMFFPTGQCRAQYPRQYARMVQMGPVCNHTYSHPHLTQLSDAAISSEIARGVRSGCDKFRPPWGDWNARVEALAAAQGYRMQMWDVDTYDWAGAPAANIVEAIRAHGGVILLHLNGYHTIEALQQL